MRGLPIPAVPGLTRQCIFLGKKMDERVKPAHDGVGAGAASLGRREFITALAAAVAWPLAARAQQPQRIRRVGVVMAGVADDPQSRLQVAAFQQRLQELGWTNDANVRIEYRWGAGDAGRYRKYAGELVALASDVIVAVGGSSVEALQDVTRAVPIVFVQVTDPVS